jgi:F-type H+-transporting ATPase subunit b
MSLLASLLAAEGELLDPARSKSWIWPETAELIWGTAASLIIFGALYKFAGPAIKKAMAGRTDKIQAELDASAADQAAAAAEAAEIRHAAGDIDAERARLIAEADTQAAALLTEGRTRLEIEVAELEARADADIASAGGRINDELRAEITALAASATDAVLADGAIDAALHQDLIESFIQKVGASR